MLGESTSKANCYEKGIGPGMVPNVFYCSTWDVPIGRSLSSRPVLAAYEVTGQPGLHRETLSKTKDMDQAL